MWSEEKGQTIRKEKGRCTVRAGEDRQTDKCLALRETNSTWLCPHSFVLGGVV